MEQITTPRNMGVDIWNGYINPTTMHTWDITDNFTFTKGRHTFKAGLELRNYHEVFYQTYDAGGTVSFGDYDSIYGGTGNGIADMMLNGGPVSNNGAPAGNFGATFYQNTTQDLNINYPAREAYVQDTIKLKPRLIVMLGARLQPYYRSSSPSREFRDLPSRPAVHGISNGAGGVGHYRRPGYPK